MKKIFTLLLSVLLMGAFAANAVRPEQASGQVNLARAEDGHFYIVGQLTAPTKTQSYYGDGIDLEYIDEIYVNRSCYDAGELDVRVASFVDPEPGASFSFEDHGVQKGYEYTYAIYVVVDEDTSYGTYLYSPFIGVKLNMPDMSLSLPEDGMPPVTVTIVAPKTTADGDEYEGNMSLVLKRREGYGETVAIKTFENVAPGASVVYEDTPENLSVTYYYLATAECEDGGSAEKQVSIYVGHDLPGAPSNVQTSLTDEGGVLISWTAPSYGVQGGSFLTPVHYKVTRNDGKVITEDTTETSIVDPCDDLNAPTSLQYSVYAFNADGGNASRATATSGNIVAGPPARLPFLESFNGGSGYYPEPSNIWTKDYNWSCSKNDWYTGLTGVNGDPDDYDSYEGYMECYISTYYSDPYETHEMISPSIDMSNSVNPVLSFYYHPSACECLIRVYTIQGEDKQLVLELPVSEGVGESDELWRQVFVALPHAAGHNATAVSIAAVGAEDPSNNSSVYIDEVEIDDYPYVLKPVATANLEDGTITLEWANPSTETKAAEEFTVAVNGEAVHRTSETSYVHAAVPDTDYKMAVHAHYGSFMAEAPESEHVMATLGNQSGVENVTLAGDAVSVEYYNLQGIRVDAPAAGTTIIRRAIKADGSAVSSKIVVR